MKKISFTSVLQSKSANRQSTHIPCSSKMQQRAFQQQAFYHTQQQQPQSLQQFYSLYENDPNQAYTLNLNASKSQPDHPSYQQSIQMINSRSHEVEEDPQMDLESWIETQKSLQNASKSLQRNSQSVYTEFREVDRKDNQHNLLFQNSTKRQQNIRFSNKPKQSNSSSYMGQSSRRASVRMEESSSSRSEQLFIHGKLEESKKALKVQNDENRQLSEEFERIKDQKISELLIKADKSNKLSKEKVNQMIASAMKNVHAEIEQMAEDLIEQKKSNESKPQNQIQGGVCLPSADEQKQENSESLLMNDSTDMLESQRREQMKAKIKSYINGINEAKSQSKEQNPYNSRYCRAEEGQSSQFRDEEISDPNAKKNTEALDQLKMNVMQPEQNVDSVGYSFSNQQMVCEHSFNANSNQSEAAEISLGHNGHHFEGQNEDPRSDFRKQCQQRVAPEVYQPQENQFQSDQQENGRFSLPNIDQIRSERGQTEEDEKKVEEEVSQSQYRHEQTRKGGQTAEPSEMGNRSKQSMGDSVATKKKSHALDSKEKLTVTSPMSKMGNLVNSKHYEESIVREFNSSLCSSIVQSRKSTNHQYAVSSPLGAPKQSDSIQLVESRKGECNTLQSLEKSHDYASAKEIMTKFSAKPTKVSFDNAKSPEGAEGKKVTDQSPTDGNAREIKTYEFYYKNEASNSNPPSSSTSSGLLAMKPLSIELPSETQIKKQDNPSSNESQSQLPSYTKQSPLFSLKQSQVFDSQEKKQLSGSPYQNSKFESQTLNTLISNQQPNKDKGFDEAKNKHSEQNTKVSLDEGHPSVTDTHNNSSSRSFLATLQLKKSIEVDLPSEKTYEPSQAKQKDSWCSEQSKPMTDSQKVNPSTPLLSSECTQNIQPQTVSCAVGSVPSVRVELPLKKSLMKVSLKNSKSDKSPMAFKSSVCESSKNLGGLSLMRESSAKAEIMMASKQNQMGNMNLRTESSLRGKPLSISPINTSVGSKKAVSKVNESMSSDFDLALD